MKRFLFKIFGRVLFLSVFLIVSGCSITNSSLIEVRNQELAQALESDSKFFIYIGRPTCPICEDFESILENALEELDNNLYYFNTDKARDEDEEKMLALIESLEIVAVPTIIYVEYGEVISQLNGLHTQVEVIDFFETYSDN
ncbi:hypothetical protein A5886_001214 [Enterococcus sp. 8G7_MSG3316]|uniref:Thioredoxin domain-containing protein n=1 Tax=Candidatus Enterococcus testudinis TaxID=1834191 RepID=A0A242A521_9ENTE|nr:thioredoxin family protein [Enterococcus sp. 8G7_MSG3316]OTN76137.1 hypothetical protein A5886_001214 [Enterococcus sp. 8G7_MSG3316]